MRTKVIVYDDYNNQIYRQGRGGEYIGTLTTNCGAEALRTGVKLIELQEEEDE